MSGSAASANLAPLRPPRSESGPGRGRHRGLACLLPSPTLPPKTPPYPHPIESRYLMETSKAPPTKTSPRWVIFTITTITLILAILVAAIPSALFIMRRADAQVVLGNAKSLRLALQVAATECYASGEPFCDASQEGGVTETVWTRVITDSKIPGDFWVLQTDEGGYEVMRFLYQEGDFTVMYCKEPLTYEVYYQESYLRTHYPVQKEASP